MQTTQSPKAGERTHIKIGDMIQVSVKNSPGWRGVVKGIELVRLFRDSKRTPRYQVTDGDHQWTVDFKDVVFVYAGCDPKDFDAVRSICA